jgi:hypothetical protein
MAPADAIVFLYRMKSEQLRLASQHETDSKTTLASVTTDSDRPFREKTVEARAANINVVEAKRLTSLISVMYGTAESPFQVSSNQANTLEERIQSVTRSLQSELHKLSESKPALFP